MATMKTSLVYSADRVHELLETTSYRDFLRRALDVPSSGARWGNFASFSRRAGFSSRSFPREVISGRKRITPGSLPRFIQGMSLKGDLKSYFTLLVALEEEAVNSSGLSSEKILDRLEKIRNRVKMSAEGTSSVGPDQLQSLLHWPEIFAALGTMDRGATVSEVCSRTRLPESICKGVLEELLKRGAVTGEPAGGRYFPLSPHLIFNDHGKSPSSRQMFLHAMERASQSSRTKFDSTDRLFFQSVISIDSARAPEFKRELRELLLKFLDRIEDPSGDSVGRVVLAFEPN